MSTDISRHFCREWVARTFAPAFRRTGLVNLGVSIALGFIAWKWPRLGGLGTTLRWLLPLGVFAGFFVWRWFRSPLEIVLALDGEREAAERRAAVAEDELRETRDCQAIADFLTQEHHYGLHELLHKPPKNAEGLEQWNQWVANWNDAIFRRTEAVGCTPQELNHVRSISILDVTSGMAPLPAFPRSIDFRERIMERFEYQAAEAARKIDIPVRMHAIRLNRIADISTKYATRAEEIRLAATKRFVAVDRQP